MKILIIGAGMMGRAVAFDLAAFSKFDTICVSDIDKKTLDSAKTFLYDNKIEYEILDVSD